MRAAPSISKLDWRDSPLEVLARWPRNRPVMMLHSGRFHPRWARWSILSSPSAMFRHHQGRSTIEVLDAEGESLAGVRFRPDPLADLDAMVDATRIGEQGRDEERRGTQDSEPRTQNSLPFSGGWIGNLSYELGRVIEPAVGPGRWRGEDDPWPLVEWGWCSWALVFDHLAGEWWLAGEMPKDWVWRRVSEGEDSFSCSEVRAVTGREAYLAAVERAIEYIRAGDIYQANIAQRFEADFSGSTRGLARAAMEAAQPWYGAYLELSPDRCAISMSPELFLEWNRRSGAMLTRPMKGTRPAACDAAVLERSIKDAAELAMIVDLMRNDLSRVSEIGSVRVARARAIESHPMVHQAVAEVVGCSRPGTSVADLIRAMFPGGSITGAPKIRAMQIIDELETHSRGPMFGAIGAWDDLGRATLGMAIRTMWIRGGAKPGRIGFLERASVEYASGCGIVVESDPEGENLECFHKLEAFRRALRSPPERAALSRSRRPKGAESQVSTPATSALLQMRTACGR